MLDVVEVAPGIHRLGRKRHSFYLIAEAGKVTVVDAVVVTHAHTHHIGFAGAAAERGIPVEVLEAEAAFAMDRSAGSQVDMTDLPLWKPRVILFLTEMVRAGAHNRVAVPGVETVDHGEVLDVPGSPASWRRRVTPQGTPVTCWPIVACSSRAMRSLRSTPSTEQRARSSFPTSSIENLGRLDSRCSTSNRSTPHSCSPVSVLRGTVPSPKP